MFRPVMILCSGILFVAPLPVLAQTNTPPSKLQSLVNDTAKQLHLSYRHNLTQSHARYEQVRLAIAAWKAATRNDANDQLLAQWLRHAIRNSMPGSHVPLPAIPEFDRPAVRTGNTPTSQAKPQAKAASAESATAGNAPGVDPFRDDPGQEAAATPASEAKK